MADFEYNPVAGWEDETIFPDYPTAQEVRPMLQRLFDQIRNAFNAHTAETATSTTQPHGLPKNKLDATTAPTVNDNSGDGYSVNSVWIDTIANKAYICLDSTVGAAVWKDITATASTVLPGYNGILYEYGTEYVKWIQGYKDGTGVFTRDEDNFLVTQTTAISNNYIVTEVTIDVTNLSSIKIDWEQVGTMDSTSRARIGIGAVRDDANYENGFLSELTAFTRKITTLDVSGDTGAQFLKVMALTSGGTNSQVKVYRIWGE
jgi:uncharacterized protein YlxP (DUF503 family)